MHWKVKRWCDSSGLKIDINNARHADNKPITHLRRGQNDDDAVMLSQMTDITIKKVVMDNLLPQTIKQLIPHHHSADYRNQDFVNKQFIDSKAVTLDPSKGLNMKGNKPDNLADPANATDSSNKQFLI